MCLAISHDWELHRSGSLSARHFLSLFVFVLRRAIHVLNLRVFYRLADPEPRATLCFLSSIHKKYW